MTESPTGLLRVIRRGERTRFPSSFLSIPSSQKSFLSPMKEWDFFSKSDFTKGRNSLFLDQFGLADLSNMPTRQIEAPQALNKQRLLPVRQIFPMMMNQISCFQTWAVVLRQPEADSPFL